MLVIFDKHPDKIFGQRYFAGERFNVFGFEDFLVGGRRKRMFLELFLWQIGFESAFQIVLNEQFRLLILNF